MHGYGKPDHKATGQQTPLHARSLYVEDQQGEALWFCCLDLGYVTHAMREGVLEALRNTAGADFDEARLVLTCTLTHSGPGGCTHDVLYNLDAPGFQPEHLARVVEAASQSLLEPQVCRAGRTGAAPGPAGRTHTGCLNRSCGLQPQPGRRATRKPAPRKPWMNHVCWPCASKTR